MVMENDRFFGGSNRYYALKSLFGFGRGQKDDSEEETKIRKLLHSYQSGLSKRVELCCKQWNQTVRDHIKNEMALGRTIRDMKQHVPVRVVDGLPGPFAQIVHKFPDIEIWELILNRPLLLQAERGLELVNQKFGSIIKWKPELNQLSESELDKTRKYLNSLTQELEKLEIKKKIFDIREDILGAYFFHIPEVHIYWMVIGIISGMIGVSADALTVVVLTHELAHAYSHLGHDTDGEQWETDSFAKTDLEIIEGLAQFYTSVVCEKISDRNPNVKEAFEKLLEKQDGPYKVHMDWTKDEERAREVVRLALIECRSKGITQYKEFKSRLEEAKSRIGRRLKTSQPKSF